MDISSWNAFEDLLYKLSEQPGYKPKKDERRDGSPLISPAIFKPGETRKNVNVIAWGGWAAFDIDDYDSTPDEAAAVFNDYTHCKYSSASSTHEKPKFRVVIPCSRYIEADEIRHFWYACNKHFKHLGDPQTKDLSRMYYVPADYPGSFKFIQSHRSEILNPDEILKMYPYVQVYKTSLSSALPEKMQEKILEYRKGKLTNTSYKWTSYKNCPFVNRELVGSYFSISQSGWYKKMYDIMLSIAASAIRKGYPITAYEISQLCREIDLESGGWYKNRNFDIESARAIEYCIENM